MARIIQPALNSSVRRIHYLLFCIILLRKIFSLSERQVREIDDFKGRNTKLEADNQDLKQMVTKVC